MLHSEKGSEWRRWDLHIHTPFTKLSNGYYGESAQEIWDQYIEIIENSPIQVFGITDYFSCENYYTLVEQYRKKYPSSEKVFFLNIEFRFSEAINKTSTSPNVHVIFDNDEEFCPKNKIIKFLNTLKTLQSDDYGVKISCSDLKTTSDFESASISIDNLIGALRETFGDSNPYLLAFPANNDGIRSTDSKSPRKIVISDKIDKLSDLFFGNSGNKEYFLSDNRYQMGKSEPKPVVSGSDSHSFDDLVRLEGNVANYEPTWIKADLTFRGLRQICFEPGCRVFIGSEPPVEERKAHQATKFLSRLYINQIKGYDERNGVWFKNVEVPINPELTAIIGNKGSGKSAIVDIIGLLCDSDQHRYFSFLTDIPQNKKFKQKGYAENFQADLVWESGKRITKGLNDIVDITKQKSVRYLPQNYFEQLTNEIEIRQFRHEIEDVVFSHVEASDRMGKSNFEDLLEFKTQQSIHEINALKASLRELNIEIIRLEEAKDPLFKKRLEEELKNKQEELQALEKSKPTEVSKPNKESVEQKSLAEEIGQLTKKLQDIQNKGKTTAEILTKKKSRFQSLTTLQQNLISIDTFVNEQKIELKPTCDELGLDIEEILKLKLNLFSISQKLADVQSEISEIEIDNNIETTKTIGYESLKSLPDLRKMYNYIQKQIDQLKELLDTPQRKYQAYLEKLSIWNSKKIEIIGNDNPISPGTIKYFETQISYIDNELSERLTFALDKRKEICKRIFESKSQVLNFYIELKNSVEERLNAVRTNDFSVNIDSSFVLDHFFPESFLNLINKTKRGAFNGRNDPPKVIKELLKEVNWNNFGSIIDFTEKIINKMRIYEGEQLSIVDQVNDIKDFYNFLFSFDYFSAKYELRLGDKNLNELSPGEKGLLLLVFYLQLDKDNIPLVIDQPEDNLDNESIFTVLATCIREAKKNRQVILVTHNPNLAVGADAEQIIYVQLEKAKKYKFTYESGSIENPRINSKIIDILEGTQPAFIKRRLKYQIKNN